jgi:hypothetical protein
MKSKQSDFEFKLYLDLFHTIEWITRQIWFIQKFPVFMFTKSFNNLDLDNLKFFLQQNGVECSKFW